MSTRVLVTGGAGFVGSTIALALREIDGYDVVVLDNLRRRGSELNLDRLAGAGVEFVHGDVRLPDDFNAVGPVDVIVECSAEPSVLAGTDGSVDYLYDTNLGGVYRSLEHARRHGAGLVLLSTSRVYPIEALRDLELTESRDRFDLAPEQHSAGVSSHGIAEDFPLAGARTLYGTTKLAAELFVTEYAETFGVPAITLRFGVIAGPWQMGRVDQGVFAYWLLAHQLGQPLRYLGYEGSGKQVRDVLHVADAADLVAQFVSSIGEWSGQVFNIGGGHANSCSLVELTALCSAITGQSTQVIGSGEDPRPGDIPLFITDHRRLTAATGWEPQRDLHSVMNDILSWSMPRLDQLRSALFE